jgi:hypothetical protein
MASEQDEKKRDDILKKMLQTPPTPNKPLKAIRRQYALMALEKLLEKQMAYDDDAYRYIAEVSFKIADAMMDVEKEKNA